MSPDLLKTLEEQTHTPRGVAARIESQDLRQLLEERATLLRASRRALIRADLDGDRSSHLAAVRDAVARADSP